MSFERIAIAEDGELSACGLFPAPRAEAVIKATTALDRTVAFTPLWLGDV